MKKLVVMTCTMILLAGCGTPSVEDLIEDPELLAKISGECSMMMAQGKDTKTEECENAKQATLKMQQNIMKGILGR